MTDYQPRRAAPPTRLEQSYADNMGYDTDKRNLNGARRAQSDRRVAGVYVWYDGEPQTPRRAAA